MHACWFRSLLVQELAGVQNDPVDIAQVKIDVLFVDGWETVVDIKLLEIYKRLCKSPSNW